LFVSHLSLHREHRLRTAKSSIASLLSFASRPTSTLSLLAGMPKPAHSTPPMRPITTWFAPQPRQPLKEISSPNPADDDGPSSDHPITPKASTSTLPAERASTSAEDSLPPLAHDAYSSPPRGSSFLGTPPPPATLSSANPFLAISATASTSSQPSNAEAGPSVIKHPPPPISSPQIIALDLTDDDDDDEEVAKVFKSPAKRKRMRMAFEYDLPESRSSRMMDVVTAAQMEVDEEEGEGRGGRRRLASCVGRTGRSMGIMDFLDSRSRGGVSSRRKGGSSILGPGGLSSSSKLLSLVCSPFGRSWPVLIRPSFHLIPPVSTIQHYPSTFVSSHTDDVFRIESTRYHGSFAPPFICQFSNGKAATSLSSLLRPLGQTLIGFVVIGLDL
jgi:hypothetical protein